MKRYYNNEEPDDDTEFDLSEEDEAEYVVDAADIIESMKMDLMEAQLHQNVLNKAIEIAKSDWLWFFRNPWYKTKTIEKIYTRLCRLLYSQKE